MVNLSNVRQIPKSSLPTAHWFRGTPPVQPSASPAEPSWAPLFLPSAEMQGIPKGCTPLGIAQDEYGRPILIMKAEAEDTTRLRGLEPRLLLPNPQAVDPPW